MTWIPVPVDELGTMKPRPNHARYIEVLRGMTAEQKLAVVYDLSEQSRARFRQGLRKRFPELPEEELHQLFLERIEKCHNRNY